MSGRAPSFGLVYHAGALGDFITTIPAIALWRRLGGFQRITMLGRPAHGALVPSLVQETLDVSGGRFARLYAGSGRLCEIGGHAGALVFAAEGSAILAGLSGRGILLRQDPFPPTRRHVVDWHLSLFPPEAIEPADRLPRVEASTGEPRVGPPAVAIAPGSGSAAKNWPLDRFLSIAEELRRSGPIAWVLGPAEAESGMADRIARALPGDERWSGLALVELAARLGTARLLVGNDSGVTHLAAAAGCAVVALFGASDPVVWAPRGRAVRVIGDGVCGMASLSVEQVRNACRSLLNGVAAR